MSKKRILFFLPLPPPVHGAALRNQSLVNSKILREAFDIKVVPFNFASSVQDIGRASFLKLFKFGSRGVTILWKMISFRPDLVYFNFSVYGISLYRDFIFALLFKSFTAKVVFHLRTQGVSAQVASSGVKAWMFRSIFRNAYVICISDFLSRDVKDVYHSRPIIVNNGIQDEFVEGVGIQAGGPPRLLFLSNFSVSKGALDFIIALSILKKNGVQFRATIAGQPKDLTVRRIEEEIAKEGLGTELSLLGPQYGAKKNRLFYEADVFVFPSHFEAFPGVLLEAMQFKLPVLSTYEGAIPEIVDDRITGFLVTKGSPKELAEKLSILISDSGMRARFGAAGREKFIKRFTLLHFEERMKSAFDEILADS